jgi:16S rRNA (adenine1518-N6/adenine1519-N6)-dimethyltransferase
LSAAEVRAFLGRHGLMARRDLGQNFLCDPALADKLAASAEIGPTDTVVEIGTGQGILTRALAARAARVVTLEVDAGLVRALGAERSLPENVELIHADALQVDLADLVEQARSAPSPVRVVANLPYSAATPLLRRLLDLRESLASWSVMIQKEVARRLVAPVTSRDYGSLTVLHAVSVDVRGGLDLRPGCFYPVPRVVSSFLHVTPRAGVGLTNRELGELEGLVRAAFSHRRKTLMNSLRESGRLSHTSPEVLAILSSHGIGARARAQEVLPETWRALARDLSAARVGGTPCG